MIATIVSLVGHSSANGQEKTSSKATIVASASISAISHNDLLDELYLFASAYCDGFLSERNSLLKTYMRVLNSSSPFLNAEQRHQNENAIQAQAEAEVQEDFRYRKLRALMPYDQSSKLSRLGASYESGYRDGIKYAASHLQSFIENVKLGIMTSATDDTLEMRKGLLISAMEQASMLGLSASEAEGATDSVKIVRRESD